MCRCMFFTNYGQFGAIISSNILSAAFLSSSQTPGVCMLSAISPASLAPFTFLHSSLTCFKFADSSAHLAWLLSPSSEFSISVIVLLNSNT